MRFCKTLVAVVGSAVLLGMMVGSVSARQLSVSETRLTATFSRVEISGGFATTRCELTLTNSLHSRVIPKVLESLIGYVTGASIGGCERGSATILRETLPWHQRYAGFQGTLPEVRGLATRIAGANIKIRDPAGFECLMRTAGANPLTATMNFIARKLASIGLGGTGIVCLFTNATFGGFSREILPGNYEVALI
jgi:hypothetical protein